VAGVALITISIWLFFESKPPPPISPPNDNNEVSQLDIKGKVVDIFDNPREDVIVIIRGIQRYAITDKYGEYHISNVPFNNIITLEAYYGNEKDTINASLDKGNIGGIENISEHLILNPIEIEATLCEYVDKDDKDYSIEGEFERENPRIPLDSLRVDEEQNLKEIWCFVIVYGPIEYQIGKNTEIRYEWYYNKEIQRRPFEQQVGFNPHGWRTRASKKVWKGEWELIIKTKHKELVKIPFEIF